MRGIRTDRRHTVRACYAAYVIQAIIVTFAPLLFVTFSEEFSLSLDRITLLTTVNFAVQLLFDLVCDPIVKRLGYRRTMVVSHAAMAAGLVCMAFLADAMPDPYVGLLLSVAVYASGGGLSQILVNPIIVSCSGDERGGALSMVHSMFCWGQVLVSVLSTAFFVAAGTEEWRLLALIWAAAPAANMVYFMFVPVDEPERLPGRKKRSSFGTLASEPLFWIFIAMMVCSGACEHAMSQWASAFAETALGVGKTAGDLLGLCAFAVCMGTARTLYGKGNSRIDLEKMMFGSAVLCTACFVTAAFSPWPAAALLGCALCGFSVGIFWPGTFHLAASAVPAGGTAMYALLSLAGDVGCAGGPTAVGFVAEAFGNDLRIGLAAAVVFPILMLLGLFLAKRKTAVRRCRCRSPSSLRGRPSRGHRHSLRPVPDPLLSSPPEGPYG